MNKKTIWDYIQLGTNLRFVQDVRIGYKIQGEGWLIENIEALLNEIEKLELDVTLRACSELQTFLTSVKEKQELQVEDCEKLSEIVKQIRHTLCAEARGKFAFVTSEKRYDNNKLLNNFDKLFAPGIFNNLPEMAKYDFSEAGKCIVFERPTAGAFHLLRGTEVLVRLYYKKFLRKKSEGKTWGQLLTELKNKPSGKKPNQTTVNHLVNIKDSFRNPTQHPDKVYDLHEVQDLLSLCIDVVNRMIKEIN